MRLLLWFTYFLIAYGSLFPFDFSLLELKRHFSTLLNVEISGIGDFFGNVLLFMPLGLLSRANYLQCKIAGPNGPIINPFHLLWLKVFSFALLLQLLQIALPSRDQNIIDVLLNMFGFALGFYSFSMFNMRSLNFQSQLKYLPIAIGLTYFLSELSPFVPSFDFQGIKDSVKPLLIQPSVSLIFDVFIETVIWLLVIRLLSFQQKKIPIKIIFSLWIAMLFAKVIIYFNYLTISLLIAPVIAILLTMKVNIMSEENTKKLFWLAWVVFGFSSMASLGNKNITGEMFVPFTSYLHGQLYQGLSSLLYKLFWFFSIIWLAIEQGKNAKNIAFFLAIYVAVIEFLQLFMPTRTFDLGDILLVMFAYLIIRNLGDYLASQDESYLVNHSKNENIGISPVVSVSTNPRFFMIFGLSFVVFYCVVGFLLSLPGVPYNVIELFEHKGSFFDLFFFFSFLLSLGGGSRYIVEKMVKLPSLSVMKYVGLHVATLSFLFFCLWCAVTTESLEDLVGSSKLSHAISNSKASDGFIPMLLKVLSLSLVTKFGQFIEFLCRFIALFGLFQIPLTLGLMFFKESIPRVTVMKFTMVSLLLFTFCYYVVFIGAVTDNLTELISSPVNLSISIILFMFLVAVQKQLIAKERAFIAYFLLLVVSLVSWFVAQYAFEQVVIKYGFTFSAFDFLIGAGRENKVSEARLILRWSILIAVFQLILLFGIQFFKQLANIAINLAINRKIVTYAYITILSVALVYVGNRLFGEHMHWQTIAQHFTNNYQQSFNLDESVAHVPENFKEGVAYLNDEPMGSLVQAFERAKSNDTIRLTQGYYNEAAVLKANNVSVLADVGAVVFGKAAQGKGALVIKGDNTYIENLECHSISVPDNNGVCIRLEGKGLSLNNVYFHHAQGGLLGSKKGGDIRIENSRFEHLGDGAFYHGIYTLAPSRLLINNSYFLNTRNGGHEIKSRSVYTEITNSVVAASQSRDSRLIDVPNGGVLVVKNNILIEGPFSENHDLLSWGVEGVLHSKEKVIIERNTIISDKSHARLISLKRKPKTIRIEGNIVIGNIEGLSREENVMLRDRVELSIPSAPFIPTLEH